MNVHETPSGESLADGQVNELSTLIAGIRKCLASAPKNARPMRTTTVTWKLQEWLWIQLEETPIFCSKVVHFPAFI